MRQHYRRFERRLTEVYVYPEICKYQDGITDVNDYMRFLDCEPRDEGFMIYVHIPFCEALCYFCNYYKVVIRKNAYDERKQLFNAYVREIENYATRSYFAGRPVRAVQFGGGTPSAVEPEFIAQILDAIRANFKCDFEIISMEGNVTSLTDVEKLRQFKDAGVQRISFGVQTFNEEIRKKLHLKATILDIYNAVEALNKVGFDDYSHDLMFNLPDQTLDDIHSDFEIVDRDIRPTYIDCYNLNVMPNTMFSAALQNESYCAEAPTDYKELAMMRELMRLAKEKGYNQVMSNIFSKTKAQCAPTIRMELDGSETIGIGPSARGYLMGRNYRNLADLKGYAERVASQSYSVCAGNTASPEEQEERKLVMFANFTSLKLSEVRDVARFQPQFDFLMREGYAVMDEEYIRLTEEGKIWPGNISELFFSDNQRTRRSRAMLNALRHKENPYNQDHMGVSAALYRRRSSGQQNRIDA